jgi:peptidyl-prolyl cis-trans isomerase D
MRVILVVTVVAFLTGTFVIGFGTSLAADNSGSTVVTIDSAKIPLTLFNSLYNNTLEQVRQANPNIQLTDDQTRQIKGRVLEELIQTEIFAQQAEKYGILVSDGELQRNIAQTPIFLNNGVFDRAIYQNFLASLNITAKDYENLIRKQILGGKLRMILIPSVRVTPSEFSDIARFNPKITINDYAQIKVNRILNEWFQGIMKTYTDKNKIVVNEQLIA